MITSKICTSGGISRDILITYATRYGSTTEIATAIADTLRLSGHRVDLVLVDSNPDPTRYDALILGSPLYMGKWLRSMTDYISRHKVTLAATPHALFTVGYTLHLGGDRELAAARLAELEFLHLINPVCSGYFAGKLKMEGLNEADKAICRMVGLPDGDYRDPSKAAEWAGEALSYLLPAL